MRLAPSEEQAAFGRSVHDLLGAADLPSVAAAWATGDHEPGREVWARLAEIGVAGLAVPERWGGAGGTAADLVVVVEELGHHALPGPVIESIAVAPVLLAGLGGGPAEKWLPELAAGRVIATVAATWPAEAMGTGLPRAVDAEMADLVLVVQEGTVSTGRLGSSYPSIERSRRLTDIGRGRVLAEGPAAFAAVRDAIDVGALACAAELLGAGRALLETTIGYARKRSQFGRPIGSFQAVQQSLAEVAVGLEFARPLLYAAAVSVGSGESGSVPNVPSQHRDRSSDSHLTAGFADSRARDVSAAKVACGEAAHRAARVALQVHGAIGYTEEFGLGRWLTRVRALRNAWGTPSQHRARVLASLARPTPAAQAAHRDSPDLSDFSAQLEETP